jgi:hypothetical protein
MLTESGSKNHCTYHVKGKCTLESCMWQNKKDSTACTLGGVLTHDRLTPRVIVKYGFPVPEGMEV